MGLFEAAYKTLNERQRQAVETLEGPLLVIAGPGTGKTQLLSMRVANILKKTDTNPQQILCLTFTNMAAANMRQRLLQLAGSETQSVIIKTFHGFAAEVMNRYPEHFWNGATLTTIPDALQLDIVQDILASLPVSNPLSATFGGTFTMLGDVLNGMSLAKEAGLTPEKLQALLEVNLVYIDQIEPLVIEALSPVLSVKRVPELVAKVYELPEQPIGQLIAPLQPLHTVMRDSLQAAVSADDGTGKTAQVGAWKKRYLQSVQGVKGMHQERKRNQWWQYLATVYARYRDELHARGYYDYSDMILEVITQIESSAELRSAVQEQFSYVLIDEFQDTNAAQMRLAHLVADHYSSEGRPNLMVVGDDDQSIYKFNGAELNNMLSFRHTYRDVITVVLEDNYRSTQAVLDCAKQTIEHATYRLVTVEQDIQKNLVARATIAAGDIAHSIYATNEHQLSGAAQDIAKRYGDGQHDIAVLARGHESLRRIAAQLRQLEVPVRYEQQSNILDDPLVAQTILLAQAAVAIFDGDIELANSAIAEIIRHDSWSIQPQVAWSIAIAARKEHDWLSALSASTDAHAQSLAHWLLELSSIATTEPLPLAMEYIQGRRTISTQPSPLLATVRTQTVDSQLITSLSALRLITKLCSDVAKVTENATLRDLLRYVELMRANGKIIADQSAFVSGLEAVQLMTVHKAKGLEFDHVYVIDCMEQTWRPRSAKRIPPANLPLQQYGDDMDDYARLMYVALTRAKRSITICSYGFNDNNEPVLPTPLIAHIAPTSQEATLQSTAQALTLATSWPRLVTSDEQLLLQPLLENYKLSATGLLQFLDVTTGGPQTFLQRSLLRIPEPRSNALSFGTAIHAASVASLASNGVLNPAVSFGLQSFTYEYVFGPLAGAVVGVVGYNYFFGLVPAKKKK